MTLHTLEMKWSLPLYLQLRLQNKYGFYVQQRVFNEKIIFCKYTKVVDKKGHDYKAAKVQDTIIPANVTGSAITIADVKADIAAVVDEKKAEVKFHLSDYRRKDLTKRCDNIVKMFPDPYNSVGPIRARLEGMASGLLVSDRAFILDYRDENFPADLVKATK